MTRERFTSFAWLVLAFNIVVILWGVVVRATGSGAGCGSDWPLCKGEVVPQKPAVETLIEFSHRLTSGLALLLAVALLVYALRRFERGHVVRRAATWTMVFMLGEAAIGAGLVLLELVADNTSEMRAWFMAAHLGNTFLLLAALALTAFWSSTRNRLRPTGERRLTRLAVASLIVVMITGVTGAVTALGDTLYPPESHADAQRQSASPDAHLTVKWRDVHPVLAVLGSLLLFYFVSQLRRRRPRAQVRKLANRLNLLVIAQLAAGTINVVLLAPIWMQVVHLLLADLVWIVLVLTAAGASFQEEESPLDTVTGGVA